MVDRMFRHKSTIGWFITHHVITQFAETLREIQLFIALAASMVTRVANTIKKCEQDGY
jgi:hypothetical protein